MTSSSTQDTRIRRTKLRAQRLCTMCGKAPPVMGYDHCTRCRQYLAVYNRERRLNRSRERFDAIVDRGLITVKDAAKMLRVSAASVHRFIDRGWLKVADNMDHVFYVKEKDIYSLSNKRPTLTCLSCGHRWTKRRIDGNNRCHIKGCRSTKVKVTPYSYTAEHNDNRRVNH